MKVLSLFDGMACGALALQAAGVEIESYDAFEIDKYAITTSSHNFPFIKHHGNVFEADFSQFEGVDIVCGGSPCTYWSIAQKNGRETEASGMGWELFQQYVRAIKEAKPKFFIYENNKSMSKAIRQSIDEAFGFEAVFINSALVSAQSRQRLYWVGRRNPDGTYSKVNVELPEDRGIVLKDILENEVADREKSYPLKATEPICLNSKSGRGGVEGLQPSLQDRIYSIEGKGTALTTGFKPNIAIPVRIGTIESGLKNPKHDSKQYRVYSPEGKSTTLCGHGGGVGAKTGLYACPGTGFEKNCYLVENGLVDIKGEQHPIKLEDGIYTIRKLTVTECKRLQTVPEWYEFPVSDSQAYKMLGNGWTVEVIAHLINSCLSDKGESQPKVGEQIRLF